MKNSKGFTLAEMMVASVILAVTIAGAMSFFVFHSRHSADNSKMRNARETIALAFMLMQRDVLHAGFGFYDPTQSREWTVRVDKNADPKLPDRLFVAYTTFMDMFGPPGPNAKLIPGKEDMNSIFGHSPVFPDSERNEIEPAGAFSLFTYNGFPAGLDLARAKETRPFGAFISPTDAARVVWTSFPYPLAPTPTAPDTWSCPVQLEKSLTAPVVPGQVYDVLETHDAAKWVCELQRNGLRLVGGDQDLDVFNFKVTDGSTVAAPGLAPEMQTVYTFTVDFQVKFRNSQDEASLRGYNKKTWQRSSMAFTCGVRTLLANVAPLK